MGLGECFADVVVPPHQFIFRMHLEMIRKNKWTQVLLNQLWSECRYDLTGSFLNMKFVQHVYSLENYGVVVIA